MKTITLQSPGDFQFSDTPAPPAASPGNALVRVHRVGICGTDIHAFRGRQPFFTYPRILGHELGVEVVDVAENASGLRAGDRCCVEPYINCQACQACLAGSINCCMNMRTIGVHLDGGMRELFEVPIRKLHKSNALAFDQLALVETLAIGAHAVARARLQPSENVLVVGAGPIGLTCIQFAVLAGARVTVADVNPHRLAFCQAQYPVERTFLVDAAGALHQDPAHLPTAVFDATGNAQSMMNAFTSVAHAGRLIFVGLFVGDVTFNDPEFHRRETTLMASRNALPADFQRIIALIESRKIDTAPWITHRAPAQALPAAFGGWLAPEARCIKAMVEF